MTYYERVMTRCYFCGEVMAKSHAEYVIRKHENKKVFFHRSCYMKTTIGYCKKNKENGV